jgi:stage II sporulation protein D
MNGRLAIVTTFCGVLASGPLQAAQPSFTPYSPLNLQELYAKRLRFKNGIPRILVGLMRGQDAITISSNSPMRLMFDEAGIPKTNYARLGAPFRFKVIKNQAAKLRHWVVVETRSASSDAYPQDRKMHWSKLGHVARIFESGASFAVRGSILDTRTWLVAVGGFTARAPAEALLERFSQARSDGDSLFLHEEMLTPPSGIIGVYNEAGRLLHQLSGAAYIGTTATGRLLAKNVEYGRGYRWHGRQDRSYREHLYVVIDQTGKLALVNSISAEKLLRGLVPAEIFASAHIEALKTQAVTARGEIFSKLAHRHFADPYHLCSEQHCQVYAGAKSEQASTNRAVSETRGLLPARPRKTKRDPIRLVDTRYSSSSGGFSENNETVWGTKPSKSLRAKLDGSFTDPALKPFRGGLNHDNIRQFLESYPPTWSARGSLVNKRKYRWTKTFTATQADSLISRLGVGRFVDLEILGRGKGGRVTGVRVKGQSGKRLVLRELAVRRLFGNLNSGLFVLDIDRDKSGHPKTITFTGGGWGHGVGMCQMGAIGRAEHGQSFEQILAHYYNGAVAVTVY